MRTDKIVEELEELSKKSLEVFKYGFPFIVAKFIYSVKTFDERKKKAKAMLKILENMTGVVEELELFRRVAGIIWLILMRMVTLLPLSIQ